MNEQTVQAITYLQRDAHLPQTGTMNAATQAALQHLLATGNNQMGGNADPSPPLAARRCARHRVGLTPCTCPNTRAK